MPGEGFEPPTFGLQNRCTATVLTRPELLIYNIFGDGLIQNLPLATTFATEHLGGAPQSILSHPEKRRRADSRIFLHRSSDESSWVRLCGCNGSPSRRPQTSVSPVCRTPNHQESFCLLSPQPAQFFYCEAPQADGAVRSVFGDLNRNAVLVCSGLSTMRIVPRGGGDLGLHSSGGSIFRTALSIRPPLSQRLKPTSTGEQSIA